MTKRMQVFIYFTRSILEWHDMVAFHNDSDYMQIIETTMTQAARLLCTTCLGKMDGGMEGWMDGRMDGRKEGRIEN